MAAHEVRMAMELKNLIRRVQFPDHSRILMISDIHGHAEGLHALLRETGFGAEDVLVIVGDLIEKGPQTLRTIRDVMALCREYAVYPLIGNVDLSRVQMLLSDDVQQQRALLTFSLGCRRWWPSSFLEEMCREAGIPLDESMDTKTIYPKLRERFWQEIAFLQSLPAVLETQRMIFVHGGVPHEKLDELESCAPLLKRDEFLKEGLSFSKYVAVGHWPVALYSDAYPCHNPIIDRERKIISLDGGCGIKQDGQLNLLCLPDWRSDDFTLHTWDELPAVTALDDQQPSADSFHIRWTRELMPVEVTERGDVMSRITCCGHEMNVPTDYLWEKNGTTYCDDITDYRLPVRKGDLLKLLFQNEYGCYAKKDGTSGWYMGRIQK